MKFLNLLNSTLESKKKSVYNLMMDRFDAELNTYDGSRWDKLTEIYLKYHRKIKDSPILVQDGKLRNSIKVHTKIDANNGEPFFYATGNANAVRNNNKRLCLEIPSEYSEGGFLEVKMMNNLEDKLIDEGVKIYDDIIAGKL